ncbi:MAG: hypothetical protein JEZ02_10055 [Desulfatibacillum sp.]|nr:hypothetical protein [Desulfatibacillum sp.]
MKKFLAAITRPRALGILIVTGVPAIVGGGLIWWASGHSYSLVFPYEIILYTVSVIVASKAGDLEH